MFSIEYDPNPLLTLGKRKRSKENSANESTNLDSTGPSTSGLQNSSRDDKDAAHKERRRLKKLRRESKVKSTDLSPDSNEKRHKHKHKCGEEFCKHRKHKKRRKHKKHHHRENDESSTVEQQDEISQDDSVSQNGDVFMEEEDEEPQKEEKLEEDNFDPNLKEETMTEEDVASSITESSGSYYVSIFVQFF